jgi:hypothetical protein
MRAAKEIVHSRGNHGSHYVLLAGLGKEIEVVSTIDIGKLSIAP